MLHARANTTPYTHTLLTMETRVTTSPLQDGGVMAQCATWLAWSHYHYARLNYQSQIVQDTAATPRSPGMHSAVLVLSENRNHRGNNAAHTQFHHVTSACTCTSACMLKPCSLTHTAYISPVSFCNYMHRCLAQHGTTWSPTHLQLTKKNYAR